MMKTATDLETVAVAELKPHPRNYRVHPDEQIDHLIQSIREHGLYRNIVIARDGTILAGHGVVQAVEKMGLEEVPVVCLDLDPDEPQALKVLAGDNEIEHLAEQNDRLLSDMLKEIKGVDGLLGTGFDEMLLANAVFVTRDRDEIKDFDEAAAWVGLPDYELIQEPVRLVVNFRNEMDRMNFAEIAGLELAEAVVWWPPQGEFMEGLSLDVL